MHYVQILNQVLLVNVMMDMMEMVLIVLVSFHFLILCILCIGSNYILVLELNL